MTGSVTHFEIYGEQPEELAAFYSVLFGWKFERASGIDYWRIQTGSEGVKRFDGGLTYRPPSGPRCWMHYIAVESLDRAVTEAQRMGASVVRPKTAVPKTGWYAALLDPQGNPFAIWQADPTAFPMPEP